MDKAHIALIVALVAIVIAGATFFGLNKGAQTALLGSTSCANITCLAGGLRLVADAGGDFESDVAAVFSGGIQMGTSGTNITRVNSGFCNIRSSALTVLGFAPQQVECNGGTNSNVALTGVTAGDRCFLSEATTTNPAAGGSLFIQGVSASSTAGSLTVIVNNASTTAFTWTAVASTSWAYHCER